MIKVEQMGVKDIIKSARWHVLSPGFLVILPALIGLAWKPSSLCFSHIFLVCFFGFMARSLGCVWNEICDKDIDARVQRTQKRPLASKIISVYDALGFIIALLLVSVAVLSCYPQLWRMAGLVGVLGVIYPFLKRWTWSAQFFLGLCVNIGFFAKAVFLDRAFLPEEYCLYVGGVLWTVLYDTVYGLQDYDCDKKIGLCGTHIIVRESVYGRWMLLGLGVGASLLWTIAGIMACSQKWFFVGAFFLSYRLLRELWFFDKTSVEQAKLFFQKSLYWTVGWLILAIVSS